MTTTMPRSDGNTVQTRASLVQGPLQAGDEDRWQEFYRLYAPVIRGFALRAGLTETEADEVVQDTCIGVAKNMGEFHYDPKVCRFKSWLLNLASWRVKNQFHLQGLAALLWRAASALADVRHASDRPLRHGRSPPGP